MLQVFSHPTHAILSDGKLAGKRHDSKFMSQLHTLNFTSHLRLIQSHEIQMHTLSLVQKWK